MTEKERMTTIWVSWDTYRKILKVKAEMMKIDGHARNPDSVVRELIEILEETSDLGM